MEATSCAPPAGGPGSASSQLTWPIGACILPGAGIRSSLLLQRSAGKAQASVLAITALRVNAVVVYTSDLGRARAFYEELLGLNLLDRTSDREDPHWGGYIQKVYFAIQYRPTRRGAEQRVGFSLEVQDLEVMVEKLRCASVRIAIEPCTRPYGRIAGVLDPDGNLLYLHQVVGDSAAAEPAQGRVTT